MTLGRFFFSNHRSNADPFFCSAALVRQCTAASFIYKSSLGKVPFAGWSALITNDLPARFGDRVQIGQMLDQARDLLSNGQNIWVFPEGTRSPSGVLQDFKPTFFKICAELGCPAVPVCILGSELAWPVGGTTMGCASVTLSFGTPLMPGSEGPDALIEGVRNAMELLARQALSGTAGAEEDPLITKRPYAHWKMPPELEDLAEEERLRLLRSGKGHQRGANIF